jgi:hypothetical protein
MEPTGADLHRTRENAALYYLPHALCSFCWRNHLVKLFPATQKNHPWQRYIVNAEQLAFRKEKEPRCVALAGFHGLNPSTVAYLKLANMTSTAWKIHVSLAIGSSKPCQPASGYPLPLPLLTASPLLCFLELQVCIAQGDWLVSESQISRMWFKLLWGGLSQNMLFRNTHMRDSTQKSWMLWVKKSEKYGKRSGGRVSVNTTDSTHLSLLPLFPWCWLFSGHGCRSESWGYLIREASARENSKCIGSGALNLLRSLCLLQGLTFQLMFYFWKIMN